MTTGIRTIRQNQAPQHAPAQIEQLKTSWQALLRSPLATLDQRNEVAMTVDALSVPCAAPKLMHRVLALLAPYYSNDVPQSVREIEAEDWLVALGGLPEWAVVAAARWWKSDANANRRKRPFEGDIAERAKLEMGIVKVGEWAVKRFDSGIRPAPAAAPRQGPTPEELEHRRKFAESVIAGKFPSMRAAE